MGHRHLFRASQMSGNERDQNHVRMHELRPYMHSVRAAAAVNGTLVYPVENWPCDGICYSVARSNGYPSSFYNAEIPQYRPDLQDPSHGPALADYYYPQNASSSSHGRQTFLGTQPGFVDHPFTCARGPHKRQSPGFYGSGSSYNHPMACRALSLRAEGSSRPLFLNNPFPPQTYTTTMTPAQWGPWVPAAGTFHDANHSPAGYLRRNQFLQNLPGNSAQNYSQRSTLAFRATPLFVGWHGRLRVPDEIYRSFSDELSPEVVMSRNDEHMEMISADVDNMSYEELLALGERIGHVSTGLTEDVISKCLRHCSLDERQDSTGCVICLEEYGKWEDVVALKMCRHDYHVECIRTWLLMKNMCPVCKTSTVGDEV